MIYFLGDKDTRFQTLFFAIEYSLSNIDVYWLRFYKAYLIEILSSSICFIVVKHMLKYFVIIHKM